MATNSDLPITGRLGGLQLSRRSLLVAGAAAGGALAVPGLLAPTSAWAASVPFSAYHGVDGAGHQRKYNELSAQGYRMISLSAYGSPTLYAAVWVKRSGPAWAAVHGVSAASYQAKVNELPSRGTCRRS
ncbi:hypothetical protein ACFQX7_29130 [Luedemannella flava]